MTAKPGVRFEFPAPAQRERVPVEPQAGLPDLLRAGTESARSQGLQANHCRVTDQTPQAAKAGQTRCYGGAGGAQHHLPLAHECMRGRAAGRWTSWQTPSLMAARSGCGTYSMTSTLRVGGSGSTFPSQYKGISAGWTRRGKNGSPDHLLILLHIEGARKALHHKGRQ